MESGKPSTPGNERLSLSMILLLSSRGTPIGVSSAVDVFGSAMKSRGSESFHLQKEE
jgi:hypothetical protein